jgi:hypothetical protein
VPSKRGRKRTVKYERVVAYAAAHAELSQSDVATHFKITQSRVSYILRAAGVEQIHRGRPISQAPNQTDEQHHWEQILHNAGLGMERGLRLRNQRILYGYDPLRTTREDTSATRNSTC